MINSETFVNEYAGDGSQNQSSSNMDMMATASIRSDRTYATTFQPYSTVHTLTLATFLGFLNFMTIVGNGLVFSAILLEQKLHSDSNYLICSLAVADLTVSVLVMPIRIVVDTSQVSAAVFYVY